MERTNRRYYEPTTPMHGREKSPERRKLDAYKRAAQMKSHTITKEEYIIGQEKEKRRIERKRLKYEEMKIKTV